VDIRYTPSDLDNIEHGVVTFETEEIGSWTFMVYGMGTPPSSFEEYKLFGSLNKEKSEQINFKNPLKE
jgi:hypothetical protein